MAELIRHIGRYTNSGSRLVVVFRKLAEEPDQCLIVETDRLPDMIRDNLLTIINSRKAQEELELYTVLTKSVFSDGSNVLQTLHNRAFMTKVDISRVEMVPFAKHPVPLADVNSAIDGAAKSEDDNVVGEVQTADVSKMDTGDADKNVAIAAGLIEQAQLMEGDAKVKREQAYALDPSLKPKAKATTKTTKKKVSDGRSKTPEEKAATLKARNERRRTSYDTKKKDDIDVELDKQVAKKVARDAEFAAN